MVYGLRELKNKSQDNCEWVKNGDFFYYLTHTMRYDALRCAMIAHRQKLAHGHPYHKH